MKIYFHGPLDSPTNRALFYNTKYWDDFAWNKYTLFSNLEIASCEICGFGFVKNKINLDELSNTERGEGGFGSTGL